MPFGGVRPEAGGLRAGLYTAQPAGVGSGQQDADGTKTDVLVPGVGDGVYDLGHG